MIFIYIHRCLVWTDDLCLLSRCFLSGEHLEDKLEESHRADGSGLEKEGMNGVLPDVIRPENQAIQLMVMEENNQHTIFTVRDILTVRQLIFYCGIALVVAVAVLLTGTLIRVFNDCG